MPLYEFACKNGHTTERVLSLSEFTESIVCQQCRRSHRQENGPDGYRAVRAVLVPSRTGTPIFKKGIGGFYNPSGA